MRELWSSERAIEREGVLSVNIRPEYGDIRYGGEDYCRYIVSKSGSTVKERRIAVARCAVYRELQEGWVGTP